MPRCDPYEQIHKKRKGGGWNPTGTRRPPVNPQGNYSDLLPRITNDTSQTSSSNISSTINGNGGMGSNTQVQADTMRSNIHVVVRIRPKNFNEKGPVHRTIVKAVGDHVVIFDPKEDPSDEQFYFQKQRSRHDYNKKPQKNLKFAYDRVYGPHNTNVEIFETSMKRLVSHIIDGFNCSIFAYGATGAGKTYTMLGSFEHPGLTFLMAMELYNRINGMANEYESEIVVSYLEVYNETLRDLLHPSGILSIREDGFNGVNIPNLTMHKPKDASELLGMLSYGNSVRTQHPTDHNAESSRSHAVFQVFVSLRKRFTQKSLKYKMAKAKLVMVDLAGSERGLGPGCDSQRFREGANINKSLLALSNCINALADGKKHIPYRDSKLTRILKDTLGGNCKTVMIANVSPSLVSYDDTYNTLKYAGRAKEIRLSCKKNYYATDPGMTYSKMVDDLQLEIQQLKTELQTVKEGRKRHEKTQPMAPHIQQEDVLCDRSYELDNNSHNNLSRSASKRNNNMISLPSPASPLLTPTQVIPDPVALENFIQLLSQKKKLEEDHAETSVECKEMEWAMQWKRWKIEAAKFAGKSENSGFGGALQHMKSQYETFMAKHKVMQEKVNLAKQVLEFNEKEIELAGGNCLNKLAMEEPFLTVTLREFLFYKSLEREVSAHKALGNYYQKMCLGIFEELLNSETMLGNCLKFHNYVYECLQDRDGITEYIEAKQHELLSPLYGGEISLKISNTYLDQPEFPPTQLLQQLWDLMRKPVIEYEPSTAPLTATGTPAENGDNDVSSPGVQSAAFPSASIDTINDAMRSAGHTPSLENSSATAASSSNDIVTIHHPRNYVSAESLLERGTTARTVPFSAAGSEDSAITEEAKTRTTTATDFEESIKYSNSNLLHYMEQEAKREMKRSSNNSNNNASSYSTKTSGRAGKVNRPGTTTVNKGQTYVQQHHHHHHHLQYNNDSSQYQQVQSTWMQNTSGNHFPSCDANNSYYTSPRSFRGDQSPGRTRVFDNAQVQVSEMDLVDSTNSASRPLTYCYPHNYNNSNDRILPNFYPGQGDR